MLRPSIVAADPYVSGAPSRGDARDLALRARFSEDGTSSHDPIAGRIDEVAQTLLAQPADLVRRLAVAGELGQLVGGEEEVGHSGLTPWDV